MGIGKNLEENGAEDENPVLSVDSNEGNPDAASVLDYLERLEAMDPEAYSVLDYMEQSTARDITKQPFAWHGIGARKPVFLDEGLTSLELLPVAKEQGWSGLALKTCKGHLDHCERTVLFDSGQVAFPSPNQPHIIRFSSVLLDSGVPPRFRRRGG